QIKFFVPLRSSALSEEPGAVRGHTHRLRPNTARHGFPIRHKHAHPPHPWPRPPHAPQLPPQSRHPYRTHLTTRPSTSYSPPTLPA
ncbi:hypothetical protein CC86DRAFT_452757, partial [Ophiobolus disseminans]